MEVDLSHPGPGSESQPDTGDRRPRRGPGACGGGLAGGAEAGGRACCTWVFRTRQEREGVCRPRRHAGRTKREDAHLPEGSKAREGTACPRAAHVCCFLLFSEPKQLRLFMAIGANAHLCARCSCWMDMALTPRLGRVSHLRESRVQSCREGFHVPWGGMSGSGTLARCVSGGGGVSSLGGSLPWFDVKETESSPGAGAGLGSPRCSRSAPG